MVYKSESNIDLKRVIKTSLKYFKKWESPTRWGLKNTEIEESAQKKHLDRFDITEKTRCTCFSDSIVISVEVDDGNINEVFSTLVANIADMGEYILTNGVLIRGGVTVGNLYHDLGNVVFGSGLIEVYQIESSLAKYPRIVLSDKLIEKLNYPIYSKSASYPYHQYIDRLSDGTVGFHQMIVLQVVQNSTVITDKQLTEHLDLIRDVIIKGLDSSFNTPNVYEKYVWLKEEYEKLLIFTDDNEVKKKKL
ncbi:hypothetical protein [Maledivibacter halophilus]|nr:hypothetical protein [Maledivibacter halophilus]